MISSALADYLRAEAGRPFTLGTADCVTLVAGWVWRSHGVDPMAYCRGYAGKTEADELLAGWGGLARAVGRGLRNAGLSMTCNPGPGDVAVVAIGDIATGAIRTPRRWALRVDAGFALVPPEGVRVIAAWRV